MAKTESTAVNQLIDSMKPGARVPARDPSDELFSMTTRVDPPQFGSPQPHRSRPRVSSTIPPMRGGEVQPLPRNRAPNGTAPHKMPNPPVRVSQTAASMSIPALPPIAPKKVHQLVVDTAMSPATPADSLNGNSWFDANKSEEISQELLSGEVRVAWDETVIRRREERQAERLALVKKLVAPTAMLAVVGVLVGGYLAFSGEGGKKHTPHAKQVAVAETADAAMPKVHESGNAATASAGGEEAQPPAKEDQLAQAAAAAVPAAVPVPAALPVPAPSDVLEVQTTRGIVKLVDVRLDSKPAGATVMLVDNGKSTLLGTTPVAASVDASHAVDIVYSLDGRTSQTLHLDPTKTHRLEAALERLATSAAPAAHHHHHHTTVAAAPSPVPATPEPAPETPKAEPETAKPAPAADKPAGNGTLMVSAKPPCTIVVDGNETGLTTPQRSLTLTAGTHQVTLANDGEHLSRTYTVTIHADQATKLIENLLP